MAKLTAVRDKRTKAQIVNAIAERAGCSRAQVKAVLEALAAEARRSLMPRSVGEFTVPELGVKLVRHKKPATKSRMGRNPATGEPVRIPARPAQTVLKLRALKSAKALIER